MIKNRKKVEQFILKHIKELDSFIGDEFNTNLYKNLFKNMTDKEFHDYITKLKTDKHYLNVIVPHKNNVKVEQLISYSKKIGLKLFQRVYYNMDDINFLTPNKYLVYHLPFRRTAQHAVKGISTPENLNRRNFLTGQVTDESRASRTSYPELLLWNGQGLNETTKEIMMARTGDVDASNIFMNKLVTKGYVTLKEIEPYAEGSMSRLTLEAYLKAAHIKMEK